VAGIVRGGSGTTPGARTDDALGFAAATDILDPKILADDTGRGVIDTVDTTGSGGTSPIPADTFVGTVSDTGQTAATPTSSVINGSFQLVDKTGNPVTPTGAVTKITLSAEGVPAPCSLGRPPIRCTTPRTPPTTVEPGTTVNVELRAVMVTGEGVLQWAPDQEHPVANWDFVVEND
jgi:hypothetical protein